MTNATLLQANADSLARLHTAEAMGTMVEAMRGHIPNPKEAAIRIKAAQAIIDRGHGRAVQAVISVPARQAVAARLAQLDDDSLMRIAVGAGATGLGAQAEGGSGGRNEGPIPPGTRTGPSPDPSADAPTHKGDGYSSQELDPRLVAGIKEHLANTPRHLAGCDIVDAELDSNDYDPCG